MGLRLVKGMDGLIVSCVAWQAALDRLAVLSEFPESVQVSKRVKQVWSFHVEDITRLLAIGAQIGDPNLQLLGLQERYSAIRYRAMTKKKRERLLYEAALQSLEARFDLPAKVKPPVATSAAPPAPTPEPQPAAEVTDA